MKSKIQFEIKLKMKFETKSEIVFEMKSRILIEMKSEINATTDLETYCHSPILSHSLSMSLSPSPLCLPHSIHILLMLLCY